MGEIEVREATIEGVETISLRGGGRILRVMRSEWEAFVLAIIDGRIAPYGRTASQLALEANAELMGQMERHTEAFKAERLDQ
jgi:hypothetical protein